MTRNIQDRRNNEVEVIGPDAQIQPKSEGIGNKISRSQTDYLDDDQLAEVKCVKCDDTIIAMFMKDHVCDKKKLEKMVVNSSGQRAEMLGAEESKDEIF